MHLADNPKLKNNKVFACLWHKGISVYNTMALGGHLHLERSVGPTFIGIVACLTSIEWSVLWECPRHIGTVPFAPTRLVGGPRGVLSCPLGRRQGRRRMRAEALKLFRKLFLNKYARVINNYFGLLCHTLFIISYDTNNEINKVTTYFRTFESMYESTSVFYTYLRACINVCIQYGIYSVYVLSTVLHV
jgi:hypothetical protein